MAITDRYDYCSKGVVEAKEEYYNSLSWYGAANYWFFKVFHDLTKWCGIFPIILIMGIVGGGNNAPLFLFIMSPAGLIGLLRATYSDHEFIQNFSLVDIPGKLHERHVSTFLYVILTYSIGYAHYSQMVPK